MKYNFTSEYNAMNVPYNGSIKGYELDCETLLESQPLVYECLEFIEFFIIQRSGVRIVVPIFIVLGTVGNIFSIITLQSKHFRNAPPSFILSVLCLIDVLLLCFGYV